MVERSRPGPSEDGGAVRGSLAVVGIGDDGPSGLADHARELIRRAELLVGGRRHLGFFVEHRAERLVITNNLDEVVERLAAEVDRRRCVVLASGDPCFFGIGPRLVERLGPERVEIVPQVSSVALAFARLGLAWQDATVLSAHGRELENVLGPAARAGKVAILTDDRYTAAAIAEALLAGGMPDCQAFVCEHLGGPAERVVRTRLGELPGQEFARLNLLVLVRPTPQPPTRVGKGGWGVGPALGRPESDYRHARGQITKAEARAVTLSKLRLPPDGVLWDVGAGSGSLSIEAAGLMPRGAIYAVERDGEQVACLRENVRRHVTPQVRVVDGEAPGVLRKLPRPDRIFVGGGGAQLVPILQACLERLEGTGRLVLNAATLESVVEAQACLRKAGWASELVQLAVSRGREVGGRTRLEPLGPVFILSAWPVGRDAEMGGRGDART
jgi:precorrin-6Y C5,15-methyltransferase (decarboxylating)